MYAWIFTRVLPGPLWLRISTAALLLVIVLAVLMLWVFPWLSEYSPLSDSALED